MHGDRERQPREGGRASKRESERRVEWRRGYHAPVLGDADRAADRVERDHVERVEHPEPGLRGVHGHLVPEPLEREEAGDPAHHGLHLAVPTKVFGEALAERSLGRGRVGGPALCGPVAAGAASYVANEPWLTVIYSRCSDIYLL